MNGKLQVLAPKDLTIRPVPSSNPPPPWLRGQEKVCVYQVGLQLWAPFANYLLYPEHHFCDVGG